MSYVERQQPSTEAAGIHLRGPRIAGVATIPDSRTLKDYTDQVRRYLKVAESAIADRADRLLPRRRLTPVQLTVRNLTDHTLDDVELTMVFHGQAQLQRVDPDSPVPELTKLPEPPAPLGKPRTIVHLPAAEQSAMALAKLASVLPKDSAISLVTVPQLWRKAPDLVTARSTPGGLEIRFLPFDLRAEQSRELPGVLLDVFEPEGSTCELSWSATSNSQPGAAKGTLAVKLMRSTFDFGQLTARS
ncbi:hypothetical protein ACFHW0_17905 [Micromonospora sp. LOL_025]|uniref:hypothetical protein n=1 Tax=Micromonospora sp. LOL_025 TaxID=3345413 RepID=UPI003A8803CA